MSVKEHINANVSSLRSLRTPVQSTLGSVTAGVGDVLSGRVIASEVTLNHQFDDLTSDEAHEAYKEYNTRVNTELNKVSFYSGFIDRLSGSLFIGAFAGIGFALTGLYGAIIAGAIMVGAALTVGLVGLMAKQHITQTGTGKSMDVADFQIKREAALIAKEIKTALDEDRAHNQEQPTTQSHSQTRHGVAEDGTRWAEYVEQNTVTSNERVH